MALCPGDSTEWEDIQRRLGNFAPKPKEIAQRDVDAALVEAAEQIQPLQHCGLDALDRLEDDADEDVLMRYRRQRLAELKAAKQAAKFGVVLQLTRTDFVAQVTEGSGEGQWVLVLLYVDSSSACHSMFGPWSEVAHRFPAVKFMRGVAAEVIPDFPDTSTPAVLVYKDRNCQKQLIGLEHWGGRCCNADIIEWVLADLGVVSTELQEDPRQAGSDAGRKSTWVRRGRRDEGSSEEEEWEFKGDRCFASSRLERNMLRSKD